MINIKFQPLLKQHECMTYLNDSTTREVLYGGGAGGGKTYLLCNWIIMNCIKYPDTRWMISRARLNMLYKTTMQEFWRLTHLYGLKKYYKFNSRNNTIYFNNGSKVFLQDLFLYSNDPDMTALRGYELTGLAIDEASEVPFKAFDILANTRIRYNLSTYNLIPKVLICSNPTKNWLYNRYYLPSLTNDLPPERKFVQSLATDNPFLTKEYLNGLKNSSEKNKQIYFFGNWDYDDNMSSLFDHENIVNSFYIPQPTPTNKKYLTADIALTGKDKTVITIWTDLNLEKIEIYSNLNTPQIVQKIKDIMIQYKININNVIIDRIGVGSGVHDLLKGSVGFIANQKALFNEEYTNLKSQCFYKLSQLINENKIYLNVSDELKDEIVTELEAHQKYKQDTDSKAAVTPKEKIKEYIGKSPDIADALSMRMYFEFKKTNMYNYSII